MAHGQLLPIAIMCQVQVSGTPTVNRMPDPAFPHSDINGRLMAHGIPVRRWNMRGWKELRGLITQTWERTMQITDYLREVMTITPSQARIDAGFKSWKNIPSTRSTGPTALKAAIKFPNWTLKTSLYPCVLWHHMARREKRSFSDHPVRKAKDSSG